MYLQVLDHEKPQNPVYFWDFGKYLAKTGQFLGKTGPETSNRDISETRFCYLLLLWLSYEAEIWPS